MAHESRTTAHWQALCGSIGIFVSYDSMNDMTDSECHQGDTVSCSFQIVIRIIMSNFSMIIPRNADLKVKMGTVAKSHLVAKAKPVSPSSKFNVSEKLLSLDPPPTN